MLKDYRTKDMKEAGERGPSALVCIRECVTPEIGQGTWSVGDKITDPAVVAKLLHNPYFKPSSEVK